MRPAVPLDGEPRADLRLRCNNLICSSTAARHARHAGRVFRSRRRTSKLPDGRNAMSTKIVEWHDRRCPRCGNPLPMQVGRGRPRTYCSDRCRWAATWDRAHARRPLACAIRIGTWPCRRPAAVYVRELDRPSAGRDPFRVAVCEQCLPLVEAFASSCAVVTGRRPLPEYFSEVLGRSGG
jgi:hypothetical protein